MESELGEGTGVTIVKPIVYGNISRYLGKKRDEDGRTHVWTAFIRPFDPNEDLSAYIRRVQFKLHESYPNPLRILNKPPFEVTETGWGEFDIVMKITFVDQSVKPLIITHLIKLFHLDHEIMMGQKSLVREIYDEIVFVDPPPAFQRAIESPSRLPPDAPTTPHETNFEEANQEALGRIVDLNNKVKEAIRAYRDQLKLKKDIAEEAKALADEVDASILGTQAS